MEENGLESLWNQEKIEGTFDKLKTHELTTNYLNLLIFDHVGGFFLQKEEMPIEVLLPTGTSNT